MSGPTPSSGPTAAPAPPRPDDLTFLLDVAHAARTRPQPEVLTTVCRGLARLLGVRVSAFIPSRRGDCLKLAICRGDVGTPPSSPQDAADILHEVVSTGRPVRRLIPGQRERDSSSSPVFAVPLGSGGALVLDGPNAAQLSEERQRLAAEVGALLGRLIDDANLMHVNERKLATATAVRQLLEAGVRAMSRFEAAQAVAQTTAAVLGVSTVCTYLVDESGLISELATYGAEPARADRLRLDLVGAQASGSPVWRRAAAGLQPGPDLIRDTSRPGAVRPGGVAEVLGLRSMASIPLLSSDGPLGLVLCGDTTGARDWRDEDRALLEQLALQATVVVDNARLRELERHEARNDSLTGLANRRAFIDELNSALRQAALTDTRVAILQIDLDRFKEINDQFGHQEGDVLLAGVADRLRDALRGADLVARLGGDEFAVLLAGNASAASAEAVALRIAEALDQPVALADHAVTVEASIGIALFPDHARDVEMLQQRADRAMYAAKRSGLGHLVYRSEHGLGGVVDPGLLGELRRALAEDELVLHYQPKVDLRSGRVMGVEALVRWEHPRLGLLGPDRFVPLAEQTGRIRSLTNWVLPRALAQARRWFDDGLDLNVAVNVSARDVADPGFPELVAGWLRDAGLPGERLTVELTEGTLMGDRVAASTVLSGLRAFGVRISIDDFGTGYSSLAYLHSLPIDEIKIDRSFLGEGERRYTVIRAILALGAGLGLRTITEGVEDAGTASMLTALGSDLAQGYYFGRAMTAEALEGTLRRGSLRALSRKRGQPALTTSAAARSPERTAPSM
ncbi:MAG TPA: EAL domain-containing protein [Frankiaceae bacterium]|nr:EAL domain-containing protein [Frankiaceae bacterium]